MEVVARQFLDLRALMQNLLLQDNEASTLKERRVARKRSVQYRFSYPSLLESLSS